jgi:hypothetical protein
MFASGPPRPGQIEICIFGPNYGECIVAHIGNDNWIVVDSCIYGERREPIALAYLRGLGVPITALKAVIVTHWHDDHCRGIRQILAAAPTARVWIALALTQHEFLRFALRHAKNSTTVAGNKLSEFMNIITEMRRRNEAGLVTFGFASARTSMYQLSEQLSGHVLVCELLALSPSPGDVLNFLDRISKNTPRVRQTKKTVPSPKPNDVSIVSMIRIGPGSVLLGADIENSGTPTAGWEAVIKNNDEAVFGPKASLYKVAHHGSERSHNPDVWQELLTKTPAAVLTPWRVADGRLPTPEGVRIILDQTRMAFATATDARTPQKRKGRPPGVGQFLRENRAIKLRSLEAPFGAVRFRTTDIGSGRWQQELFGAACPLARLRRAKGLR